MRRSPRNILAIARSSLSLGLGRRGFSLIEAVVSMVIVGGLFVVAMNTVGASRTRQLANAQRRTALLLAEDLMAEILQRPYADPDQMQANGPETGESTGNRMGFDDVDDYFGWSASPPEYRDGTAIPWADGYQREVSGTWLDPNNLSQTSGTETGIKRIEVQVKYGDRKLVALYAARARCPADPLGP